MGDEPLLFSSVVHEETNSGLDSILSLVWRESVVHDRTGTSTRGMLMLRRMVGSEPQAQMTPSSVSAVPAPKVTM
jgi:hypothetical protein